MCSWALSSQVLPPRSCSGACVCSEYCLAPARLHCCMSECHQQLPYCYHCSVSTLLVRSHTHPVKHPLCRQPQGPLTHLSRSAVLLGTPTTVGRMLSGLQLALSYGCWGARAGPRSSPPGRGKVVLSASGAPGPAASISDSNCSTSRCAGAGRHSMHDSNRIKGQHMRIELHRHRPNAVT